MIIRFKPLFAIMLLVLTLLPVSARAQITVAFYSHELGSSFPHAFIVLNGTPKSGGMPVDANFGFTAKSVSPAILMGPVSGVIESAKPGYVGHSDLKFAFTITDEQYSSLMALVEKWRILPGKSYDLNRRNCIHFVGEVAQALGLKVVFDKKLIKRPRSFLENIIRLNPMLANR
jgi:hypothetical protein